MRCPNCGTHDSEKGLGVYIRLDAISGSDLIDLLLGKEPERPEPEGPAAWCTECDYTAKSREDYDRDIETIETSEYH